MTERTLFDIPLAHRNDPDTSFEAADKMVKSGKLSKQQQWVLNLLKANDFKDGLTARELAVKQYRYHSSTAYYIIQRRLNELRLIGKAGRVLKDNTISGEDVHIIPSDNLLKRNGRCCWRILELRENLE